MEKELIALIRFLAKALTDDSKFYKNRKWRV
jgi:hypothetical protein